LGRAKRRKSQKGSGEDEDGSFHFAPHERFSGKSHGPS
jgi:hypothetical protein